MANDAAAHAGSYALPEAILLLSVAIVIAPLFHRLRASPVLGYMLAGLVLGPVGLGVIADEEVNRFLAELGVVFLLFIIGLELSLERLRLLRRLVFGLGSLQILVCGALFTGAAMACGLPLAAAAVVGFALALSSTAMVLQLLTERGELATRSGRAGFGILLMQDLAVVPLLVLVTILAGRDPEIGEAIGGALLRAAVVVAGIAAVGLLVLPRLFAVIARTHRTEAFTALALVAVLGAAWATEEAGLSMALGAFLAGLALAGARFRHQIEADIRPFEGLLLGLFFITVGVRLELAPVLSNPWVFVGLLLGLVALKATVVGLLALAFGLKPGQALRTGLLLAQGGEFAFVLVGIAGQSGVVPEGVAPMVFALTGVSMALTPFLEVAGRRLGQRFALRERSGAAESIAREAGELSEHVLICGFGRVGQTVALLLDSQKIKWMALDTNPELIDQFRRTGADVFYGDGSHRDVLVAAAIGRARAAVVTLDDTKAAAAAVVAIRHETADLPIFARARDHRHSEALNEAGATHAVPELLEASLQLGRQVLAVAGVQPEAIARLIETHRAGNYAALRELGEEEARMRAALDNGAAATAARE